jgi:hypothetical protein
MKINFYRKLFEKMKKEWNIFIKTSKKILHLLLQVRDISRAATIGTCVSKESIQIAIGS